MKTDVKVRGKIARVVNSREAAINVGSDDGVEMGMIFDILSPILQNIKDPDSGRSIGSINRPKVRVKVTKVEDRVSLVSTYKIKGGSNPLYAWASLLSPGPPQRHETLKAKDSAWEELEEKDSYVRRGDPVVQVLDEAHEG